MKKFIAVLVWLVLLFGCINQKAYKGGADIKEHMKVELPFEENGFIPEKYTCKGVDISPEIKVSEVPENTKSIAIIVDDPDAPMGTFVHWVVWNIKTNQIPEGYKSEFEGVNDFGVIGYRGPCPPPGNPHRYFFKIYALDAELSLERGARKEDLLKAMEGHIIDKVEYIGLFKR